MADDRRVDPETRARVEELEESWHGSVAALERRYRALAWFLIVGMAVTIVASTLGYALLQGERWDSAHDDCVRANRRTDAEVGLLDDLMVPSRVIVVAKRRLPHVDDCDAYSNGRVGWLRL